MNKDTTYSWSRVNYTCLSAFYMGYVQGKEGKDNIWNVGGKFEHELVEKSAKDEVSQEECLEIFDSNWYNKVEGLDNPFSYPKGGDMIDAARHYYEKTRPFFTEENTNWLLGETVSVEEHLEFTLPSGRKFQGYIDRVSVDEDGNLAIRDYKISKRFTRNNIKEKVRQLYVYAYGYEQIHGKYPKQLIFEFFQFWDKPYIVKFKKADMLEAIDYVEGRIKEIEGRYTAATKLGVKGLFLPDYNELIEENTGERNMFCKSVCSFRSDCPFTDGNHLKMFKAPDNQEFEIKK